MTTRAPTSSSLEPPPSDDHDGPGSEVTHIDYDDDDMDGQQQLTVVVPDAPISIVGAGVSTCAPTAPQ